MKEGDHVKWTPKDATDDVGVIVGRCRVPRNDLSWLVQFTGPYSFAEPFAIPERELKLQSPLEVLGASAD